MWCNILGRFCSRGRAAVSGGESAIAACRTRHIAGRQHLARPHQRTYQVHHINVTTSRERWQEAPDGLEFRVCYIDTHKDSGVNSPAAPAVLLVHGAMGSHKDFIPLIDKLTAAGIRSIVPNLPGFGFTSAANVPQDLEIFSHGISERMEFLADFLEAIEVNRIDAAVGHSFGSTAVANLAAVTDAVGSVVMINPVTHKPHRAIRPLAALHFGSMLWDRKFARLLMIPMLSVLRIILGFGFGSPYPLAYAQMTAVSCDFNQVYSDAVQLVFRKTPLTVVYSVNDRIIEPELSQQFCGLLGLPQERCTVYDRHIIQVAAASAGAATDPDSQHLTGIILQDGGHYPIKEYADLLADHIKRSIGLAKA